MKILVTGGLGYIGSHTVVELQNQGFDVVIVDNCSNATEEVLKGITAITERTVQFEKLDVSIKHHVKELFQKHPDIGGVIHFAASKAVGESVENPLLYYENNLTPIIYILKELEELKDVHFIFSSSCTVYGQAEVLPITENAPIISAKSPYGNTKQICEEILQDTCNISPKLHTISLRYFNPIGAHPSALIGELPIGIPQNLVPYITQTAIGKRECLSVFGNDYDTADGTAIRDYIHVVDLANAHVIALKRLINRQNSSNYEVYNVGTGKGSSVLEVINAFEEVSELKLNYKIVARRNGDIAEAYADTSKIQNELKWQPKFSLHDALASAWKWEQKMKSKS